MKKIGLFLGASQDGGGAFQYSQTIAEAVACLPRDEFQVVIVYLFDEWKEHIKEYDLPHKKVNIGVLGRAIGKAWRLMRLPLEGWRNVGHLFQPLARELNRQGCDLWIFPAQDAWAYRVSVHALVSILDLMHRYEKRFPEVSEGGMYEQRERHYSEICRWARGILVDSRVGKQQVIESYGADPNKIYVLPYVPPKHVYKGNQGEVSHSSYRLPDKFLFYPGHFWEHKNHKGLVRAIDRLKGKYPDLRVLFAGSKNYEYEPTRKLVEELGLLHHVLFLGYVPARNMAELYRRARGLIMPTFFGPTNIPPLEANALGCPVAVSRVYGMMEQLQDGAIYFDPASVEDIAKAIEKIWIDDELCFALRERGFSRAGEWNQVQFNRTLCEIVKVVSA
jgi:glycosyltransferase involved in cell wall biosynthesis